MIPSLRLTLYYVSSYFNKRLGDFLNIHVVLLLWYIFPAALEPYWCAVPAILFKGEVMAHHFWSPAIVFKLRWQDCALSPVVEI